MFRVLLLNMPFVSLSRPAIGISILKARLSEEGIRCDIGYGNLLFAERVGLSAYELINDRLSGWLFTGDWLFSEYVFPGEDRSPYVEFLRQELDDGEFKDVMNLRGEVFPFIEACFDEFDIAGHQIIGFSTTFEQNLASLALSQSIKKRYKDKIIVFGGGNCEGIMGLELHRQFPWIDYICSGESDNSFPALVARLCTGHTAEAVPGVICREDGESKLTAPPDRIHDLDRLPDPDYDDYFTAVRRTSLGPQLEPALLIETARGC